jgi:hypothetical protein
VWFQGAADQFVFRSVVLARQQIRRQQGSDLYSQGPWIRRLIHWNVDVFEDFTRRDASGSIRGEHKIIADRAGVFASHAVDEGKWLVQLLGTDQEAGAIGFPFTSHFFHKSASFGGGGMVDV